MTQRQALWPVLLLALLYTAFFYQTPLGLNLFLFELLVLGYAFVHHRPLFLLKAVRRLAIALFISAVFTVITHSAFSITMNFLLFIIVLGQMQAPKIRSVLTALLMGVPHFFKSQMAFLANLLRSKSGKTNRFRWLWQLRLFLIPLFVILFFLILYGNANPIYGQWVEDTIDGLARLLDQWLGGINLSLFWTFVLGLLLANFSLLRSHTQWVMEFEEGVDDVVVRKRERSSARFALLGLKNELLAAVFLFAVLNLMLMALLAVEIHSVWLHFAWSGSTLKSFVHEGTYLLILSILISIGLVLFYFRGNLNFYSKNIWLKRLSYLWLLQNAVLTIAVVIRNLWYVKFFALAHLRIGLFMFLLLTLVGLALAFLKVHQQKSLFYLLRTHSLISLFFLSLCSFVDWDRYIARYNWKHAGQSYFHFDYLAHLAPSSISELWGDEEQLREIQLWQSVQYPDEHNALTPETFQLKLQERAEAFCTDWENRPWLAWNARDYWTYQRLKQP